MTAATAFRPNIRREGRPDRLQLGVLRGPSIGGSPVCLTAAPTAAQPVSYHHSASHRAPRQRGFMVMNAARYVGRVGALAVALGVGMGLSSNLAVAVADVAGDSSSPSGDATRPVPSGDTTRPVRRGGVGGHRGAAKASAPGGVVGEQSSGGGTSAPVSVSASAATKVPTVRRGAAASVARGSEDRKSVV